MNLTAIERRKLERIFRILDTNKNETIEREDFAELADLIAGGRHLAPDDQEARALRRILLDRFDHMLTQVDHDGDGVVTLTEWLHYNDNHPADEALDRIMEQTVFGAFASDNNAGVHPKVMEALQRVNVGYAGAYGHDLHTQQATRTIREHFGDCAAHFVFNGTAANVLGLKAVTKSWQSILCADTAHIAVDEAAAPENYLGCPLVKIRTSNGKLTVASIEARRVRYDGIDRHNPTRVVSISNPTEYGTVYTPAEIRAIADYCHANELLLHLDGARIFNAAVATNASLRELTSGAGVDVFSLGGTKNGMMMGEAVLFFNRPLGEHFMYLQKQAMQTLSKMRFIGVQFSALLQDNLWHHNASQANNMAKLLGASVADIPGIELYQPVTANGVFVRVRRDLMPRLQNEAYFYVWDPDRGVLRWMTSYDTTEEDIRYFVGLVRRIVQRDTNHGKVRQTV